MKIVQLLSFVLCVTLISGCGHNYAHYDHGVGLSFRIPLPNGYSLVDLKVGNIDSQTLMLRGGSTFTSDTSKGGTLGAISVDDHTRMFTAPAINEGYIAQVLSSDKNSDDVKRILIQYLLQNGKTKELKPAQTTSVVDTKEYVNNAEKKKQKSDPGFFEKIKLDKSTMVLFLIFVVSVIIWLGCYLACRKYPNGPNK